MSNKHTVEVRCWRHGDLLNVRAVSVGGDAVVWQVDPCFYCKKESFEQGQQQGLKDPGVDPMSR